MAKSEKDKKIEALEAELALLRKKDKFNSFSTKKKVFIVSMFVLVIIVIAISVSLAFFGTSAIPHITQEEYVRIISRLNGVRWGLDKESSKKFSSLFDSSYSGEIVSEVDGNNLNIYFYSDSSFLRLPLSLNNNGVLNGNINNISFEGAFSANSYGEAEAITLYTDKERIVLERKY